MKASSNELVSLLKQALEGCGYDAGSYESAADMVVWAEMHGLGALQKLQDNLSRIGGLANPIIDIQSATDFDLCIDAGNASTLGCGELISNVIFSHAVEHGVCSAMISRIYDRPLIAKKLVDCHAREAHCLAYWLDATDQGLVHAVLTSSESCCPQISTFQTQSDLQGQALYLVYATDVDMLKSSISRHCAFITEQPCERIEPKALRANFEQALDDGVEIDEVLWRGLRALADKVLVESNYNSRKGAGA